MITSKYGKIKERKFIKEAKRWIGTPFLHRGRTYGLGVDCINYVLAIFENCHLLPYVHLGWYSFSWYLHKDKHVVFDKLIEQLSPIEIDKDFKIGDVFVYNFGRANAGHVAVFLGGKNIIHSVYNTGVIMSNMKDKTWSDRFMWALRLEDKSLGDKY